MNVSQKIARWYDSNKRLLPWRETLNPYHIWLSEIILQQTRVNQGISYYEKFILNYPTIHDLAASGIDDVMLLWQGLGYYSRARNLLKTARIIVASYGGKVPEEYSQLIKLPGIGDYTAASIASLAYNKPHAAIDGNVFRVLARYFGIERASDTTEGRNAFKLAAESLLDRNNPGRHNQSMIELGALICLPGNPRCTECPVNDSCYALKSNAIDRLPAKKKKVKVTHRYLYYLVIQKENKIFIRQRAEKDIWEMLHDFPSIETSKPVSIDILLKETMWKKYFGDRQLIIKSFSEEYKHKLSHQILHAYFIRLEVDSSFILTSAKEIGHNEISNYPVPRLIERYLADINAEYRRTGKIADKSI
jgi:A/G-specific adenine glycosylase